MVLLENWPFYIICFVIMAGYGGLLNRHYLARQVGINNLSFVIDSASFLIIVLLVGSLMSVQGSSSGGTTPSVVVTASRDVPTAAVLAIHSPLSPKTATSTVVPTRTPSLPSPSRTTPFSPPSASPVVTHVVQLGEVLLGIADQYGVPVAALLDSNPTIDPDRLAIDQVIMIPWPLVVLAPSAALARPSAIVTVPPTSSLAPSATTVPTATHTATVPPATPVPTATHTATVPPSPTASAMPFVVPSATPTLRPTEQLTRSPTISRTSTVVRIAVATASVPNTSPFIRLLSPSNGATVGSNDTALLKWEGLRPLASNQWYEVQLWFDGQKPQGRLWTKEESWSLPIAYRGRSWSWQVLVVEKDDVGEYMWRAALPASAAWVFLYER